MWRKKSVAELSQPKILSRRTFGPGSSPTYDNVTVVVANRGSTNRVADPLPYPSVSSPADKTASNQSQLALATLLAAHQFLIVLAGCWPCTHLNKST